MSTLHTMSYQMLLSSSIPTMDSPAVHTSSLLQNIASISKNNVAVGSSWMLSSMIFTTYFSTAYLKYGRSVENDLKRRKFIASVKNGDILKQVQPVIQQNPRQSRLLTKYLSRPQLLTIFRLSGSFLLGIFGHTSLFLWQDRLHRSIQSMNAFMLPALFMFLANYCNVIALDRLGISLTYTSKCGIPILTVLISILVYGIGSIPSLQTMCALSIIAIGIALASWNSPTFDLYGFIAAISSATAQASLNVSCKSALTKTQINGLQAQTTMAAMGFCFAMITTSLNSIRKYCKFKENNGEDITLENDIERDLPPFPLTVGAVCSYHVEYVLSFLFLSLVKPITYGTCDAIRRLGIIISGRQMFGGEEFSKVNYSGIGLALIGALGYSITSSK